MAEKATVGYLPGSDPESVKANMEYSAALQRMQQALEARQNRMFDPEMLALASGFLAPTQTGGFGESLGLAAKNMRQAQMEQEKEEREIAQAQLGLAGRGIELERLRQRDREFGRLMGDQPPGAPAGAPAGALPGGPTAPSAGGALPGGARPTGALTQAKPAGFEGVEGIPVAPPNPNFMSGRQYLGMARLDPTISPTTAMKEAQKMEQDRFQVKEGGVQDLSSGMFYPFPKGEQVTRQIYGYPGEYKVDARTAALLDMYAASGDPKYHDIAKRVVEGPKIPGKPGETEGEPGRIRTTTELKSEEAGATETAQQRAKAQEDERKKTIAAGSDAPSRIGMYNNLQKIASGDKAGLIFGVFERPGFWPQVGTLIESSIGIPGATIGLPQIRKVMTNAGLPQNLIDQSQFAFSLMANIQLQISRLGEGQGAVSDFERSLFGQASITERDNPQTILAKLDMLRARAEFDREVAKAVRGFKGNIDDFKGGDEYARMVESYEGKLSNIIENRLSGTVKPSTGVSGRDNRGAASRLPAEVR